MRVSYLFSICCCVWSFAWSTEKPLILVTIPTYQQFVEYLVEDSCRVESVIPQNANCHFFEPSMKKALQYATADLWFTLGEPFEKALEKVFDSQEKKPTIIDLYFFSESGGVNDPHGWTNPLVMRKQLREIFSSLCILVPARREAMEIRYNSLLRQLDDLIVYVNAHLAGFENRPLFVAHAAFGSLCLVHHITQVPLEIGSKEMTLPYVTKIVSEGRQHHVATVFALKGFPNKGVETVAKALDAKVIELDPYVLSYFEDMRNIVIHMQQALLEEVI
jgi:zinc transport system substrate-binding protein